MFNGVTLKTLNASNSVKAQGARYLIVGSLSAVIELLVFSLLFYFVQVPIKYSSPAALLFSTIFNFILSSTWSFKGAKNIVRSIVLYILLFLINTLFSGWASDALFSLGCPGIFAKILTMACIVSWNFILYRKVVFK